MNRRITAAVVSAVAVSVVATGCSASSGHSVNRAGIVTDRDIEGHGYELETKNSSGKHEFPVSGKVYRDCSEGKYYPSCVKKSKKTDESGKSFKKKNKKKRSWPWSKKNKSPKNTKKSSKGFSFKPSKKRR